jgi:hypothetical protein
MWPSTDHHQYYNSRTVIANRLLTFQQDHIKYWTYMQCGCNEGNFPNSLLNFKRHSKISSVWLVLINACKSYHTQEIKYWYVYRMHGRSYSSFLSLCTTFRLTCVIRKQDLRGASFQKKSVLKTHKQISLTANELSI